VKVTISGSNDTAIIEETPVNIDIVIPGIQGPAGPAGAEGPEGPQGPPGASGASTWGSITGTLSDQTDLQSALNAKVTANAGITASTKTKITYDSKGLVTAGANLALSDLPTVGSNTQVIFNDGGVLGADSDLVYNKTTNTLTTTNLRQTGTTILLGFDSGLSAFSESYVTYIGVGAGKNSLNNANSIGIGENAGNGAAGTYNLCFGGYAGYQALNAGSLLAIGTNAGGSSDGLNSSIAIGTQAGYLSTGCTSSLMFGPAAGYDAENLTNTVMVGPNAGSFATYDYNGPETFASLFIGSSAGAYSVNSYGTTAIGSGAAGGHSGYRVIAIGEFAFASTSVNSSIGIGAYSFEQCFSGGSNNLGFGDYTFNYATNPQSSVAIGANAGAYSSNPTSCLFIGPSAGNASVDLTSAIGIGDSALKSATSAPSSVAIGTLSLFGVLGAQATVAIGNNAGGSEFGGGYVNSSVFVGSQSGYQAYNGSDCIFIGSNSGLNDTVDNYTTYGWNILLGSNTNTGGFSNSIAIGGWIANSAAAQCNIGNAFYIDGIYTSATQSATPVTTAKVGICTDLPVSTLDVTGDLKADAIYNSTGLAAGVYTPTLTGVTNVASSTAYDCQYMRVGNTVTVSGKIEITPTANSTQTTIGISLPIASVLVNDYEVGGVAHTSVNTTAGHGAAIYGDVANARAEMDYYETHGASDTFFFTFSYTVI
jgi:hypothetical protein